MMIIRNDRPPPALDIDAVRAFVLVAELQSFTRTAQATGTTQSAVSLKLKRLEARLAARLVERTPRLVRLTAEGAAFLDRARELLAVHDRDADRRRGAGAPAHDRHQRPRRRARACRPDGAGQCVRPEPASRPADRFLQRAAGSVRRRRVRCRHRAPRGHAPRRRTAAGGRVRLDRRAGLPSPGGRQAPAGDARARLAACGRMPSASSNKPRFPGPKPSPAAASPRSPRRSPPVLRLRRSPAASRRPAPPTSVRRCRCHRSAAPR